MALNLGVDKGWEMTKIDCMKEAARRDGDSEEKIERLFRLAVIEGMIPDDADEQVPRDEQEEYILEQLEMKRERLRIFLADPQKVAQELHRSLTERNSKN